MLAVGGYAVSEFRNRRRMEQAPRLYVERLSKLIRIAANEGVDSAEINSRAIVGTRNDFRKSLVSIANYLNSEIDELETQLAEKRRVRGGQEQAAKLLLDTILVLNKKWPGKKEQIEIEIRKLLAELGLPISERRKSNDDYAPPPPKAASASS